jgi:hypothetical protein
VARTRTGCFRSNYLKIRLTKSAHVQSQADEKFPFASGGCKSRDKALAPAGALCGYRRVHLIPASSSHVSTIIAWKVDELSHARVDRFLTCISQGPKARVDPKGRHRDGQCCIDAEGEDHGMLRTLTKHCSRTQIHCQRYRRFTLTRNQLVGPRAERQHSRPRAVVKPPPAGRRWWPRRDLIGAVKWEVGRTP